MPANLQPTAPTPIDLQQGLPPQGEQQSITGFLFCALLLFPFTAWSAGEDGKSQDERKIYTVIEFESTFMNRKKEKVLEVLGEPDRKWEHSGKIIWTYRHIINDQGKIWDQNILFNFGRVNQMWGNQATPKGNGK